VSQDDRMSLIEHWLVYWKSPPSENEQCFPVTTEYAANVYRVDGYRVEGPFVPASELRGAVTDLAAAVRLLNNAQTTIIDTDLRREWEAERARLRALVGRQ
jgi:hypothetical protein